MKHRNLKEHIIKVSYNAMGEQSKTLINIGKRRLQSGKIIKSTLQSAPIIPAHTHNTGNVIVENNNDVPMEVLRTIHALRDLLFGKVFRGVISPQDTNSSSLSEILSFFCQTSFGATNIAQERRADLFHAILLHQSSSSFLRVMKRLLSIPGIEVFDEKVSAIYFEAWCWLIQNDVLANQVTDMNIEVSAQNMMDCLMHVGSANGNSFSPQLLYEIEHYILSQGKNWDADSSKKKCLRLNMDDPRSSPNRKMRNQNRIGTIKVDDVLEGILQILEKHDKFAAHVECDMFYTQQSMVTSSHNIDEVNEAAIGDISILDAVKVLLSDLVANDIDRTGCIKQALFVKLLTDWYESCLEVIHVNHESMERLLLRFESIDHKESIDYIVFFGALYAFALDKEQQIPLPNELENYVEKYRGTEEHHLTCIQKYVQCVRLKLIKFPVPKNTMLITERIANSRRSIIRLRPQSSDFLSKWIVAVSSMPGVTLDPIRDGSKSQTTASGRRSMSMSTKTPLHISEPRLNVSFIDKSVPFPRNKLNSNIRAKDRIISTKKGV